MAVDLKRMLPQVTEAEGFSPKLYKDSVGKLTIGYGWCVEDWQLDETLALIILRYQLEKTRDQLFLSCPWVTKLIEDRQLVFIEMAFNLGVAGLLKFQKTLASAKNGDFELCADQMLQSKWAQQVGRRATRLAFAMRRGKWP